MSNKLQNLIGKAEKAAGATVEKLKTAKEEKAKEAAQTESDAAFAKVGVLTVLKNTGLTFEQITSALAGDSEPEAPKVPKAPKKGKK